MTTGRRAARCTPRSTRCGRRCWPGRADADAERPTRRRRRRRAAAARAGARPRRRAIAGAGPGRTASATPPARARRARARPTARPARRCCARPAGGLRRAARRSRGRGAWRCARTRLPGAAARPARGRTPSWAPAQPSASTPDGGVVAEAPGRRIDAARLAGARPTAQLDRAVGAVRRPRALGHAWSGSTARWSRSTGSAGVAMSELVALGERRLPGEVVAIRGHRRHRAGLRVHRRPGARGSGRALAAQPLSARLGPRPARRRLRRAAAAAGRAPRPG